MACTQENTVEEMYRCDHCGHENDGNSFKYFDNKKEDQPRFKCQHCHKMFTVGWHGRPKGKTYTKKRNEDPDELKGLSRQCRHCGVADNAPFKYYNNRNVSQPRFKCLSCGKQFQMRLMGAGKDRRLVHTSCGAQARAPRRQKQGIELAMPEENRKANFTSGTGTSYSEPLLLSDDDDDDDAEFADLLEAGILAEESKYGSADAVDGLLPTSSNEGAICYTANAFEELPAARSNEDDMAQMAVSDSTRNNVEAMDGTQPAVLENPTVSGSEPWTGIQNYATFVDPWDPRYAEEVAAFCGQTDVEMPTENSKEQMDTSEEDPFSMYENFARGMEMLIENRNYPSWNPYWM